MTPPIGIAHVNWGARTHERAEGIHRELWATVLLLEQGSTRAAIVDLDFLLIPSADCRRLREKVAAAADLPWQNVRLSFTHTHSGPPWSSDNMGAQDALPGMELVPAYREKVFAAVTEAAGEAKAALKPARVAASRGTSDITVSRRLKLPSGRMVVGQNWEGYRDTTLTVLRLDDRDGKAIASILGYGTHPIVLAHENRMISPDYPGATKRVVEQLVGGRCIFLQGCAGDQIPREALQADVAIADRIGTQLGVDAAQILFGLDTRPRKPRFDGVVESGAPLGIWKSEALAEVASALAVESRIVELPVRNYGSSSELVAEAASRLAAARNIDRASVAPAAIAEANYKAKRAAMDAHWAKLCAGRTRWSIELHAIRLGDAILVGAPVEPFARIGATLREGFANRVVHMGGYTNGWEGYVPMADEYDHGGYEVEWATPYAPTAAETLIDHAQALARSLG
jgi:hypothetical protein